MYDDLISRQAAIDALTRFITPHDNGDGTSTIGVLSKSSIKDIVNNLPSAQPETHDKRTKTHSCDCISRQAAIDAIRDADVCVQWNGIISDEDAVDITVKATKRSLIYSVKKLPSAQPEMIREIRKWINSGNRGNADYFIVEKIEEIINKYE